MKIEIPEKYQGVQRDIILSRGENILVSASAGTGKTSVMVQRIIQLIAEGHDISNFVVVTFTNLAAAQMKQRLSKELSAYKSDRYIAQQLEKVETANISTLHSFCSELLRNYFYVVDIDPSFTILDDVMANNLKKVALKKVVEEYQQSDDQVFNEVRRIFFTKRTESTFDQTINNLYNFSRCIYNFDSWYQSKRQAFAQNQNDNPLLQEVTKYVVEMLTYNKTCLQDLCIRAQESGMGYVDKLQENVDKLTKCLSRPTADQMFAEVSNVEIDSLGRQSKKNIGDEIIHKTIVKDLKEVHDRVEKISDDVRSFYYDNIAQCWQLMGESLPHLDKLVEIVNRYDQVYFEQKKEFGGLDFNDLEHLTVKLFDDEEVNLAIHSRYQQVFVDEYQDTNPVQEEIIQRLRGENNLFMVGDVKQSIYGFRGCEPNIFVQKYNAFKSNPQLGRVFELNENYRSSKEILDFVNDVFCKVMTTDFGKVNYEVDAKFTGKKTNKLKTPTVCVDFVQKTEQKPNDVTDVYDITAQPDAMQSVTEGQRIANEIKNYVGKAYTDENGDKKIITYNDIVILTRAMTNRAQDIYNALVMHNIPVVANFKVRAYGNKEVRDIINFLRVVDNPYQDIYLAGSLLCPLCGLTENQLGAIRLDNSQVMSFYDRVVAYKDSHQDDIATKLSQFLTLVDNTRFYSRSATVGQVVLYLLQNTDYQLYVQGLPNGSIRVDKLFAFVDEIKDATYAQSIDKFLGFLDDMDESQVAQGLPTSNAVRLMTMHASKGLEFPIVFVAGIDTTFNNDTDSVVSNFDLGLGISHYKCINMTQRNTVGKLACKLRNKSKQSEEEMRLLYVAMTRAMYVLHVTCHVSDADTERLPKAPKLARSHYDWLYYSLYRDKSLLANSPQLKVELVGDVCQPKQLQQDINCQDVTDKQLQQLTQQLNYTYPYDSQAQMPTKVVSSLLDKTYLELADDEPNAVVNNDDQRNLLGTAYHVVYQYVNYEADKQQIAQTISNLVQIGKIDARFESQLDCELIYQTLRNPQLVSILQQGTVFHEKPFMLYAPYNLISADKRFTDKVMLQGVIDLLVIGKDSATVIDFKYTTKNEQQITQSYQMQLNSYRYAVQTICKIKDVDCYVLSIADNKLIKID